MGSGGSGAPAEEDDVTWLHTFFPYEFWDNEGGDFDAAAHATATIGGAGDTPEWGSTPDMVADVQSWLDDPDSSFGWLIFGNEANTNTAKKMASRENPIEEIRPELEIEFEPPPPCPGDFDDSGDVGFTDLLALLTAWGPYKPCPPFIPEDIDQDCDVGFSDLLLLLAAWGPCE